MSPCANTVINRDVLQIVQSDWIQFLPSGSASGPNVHFSSLASMPKINRNPFALPRKTCSFCPICQTFCKHCHVCWRGPLRANHWFKLWSRVSCTLDTICSFNGFNVEIRTCSLDPTAENTCMIEEDLTSGIKQRTCVSNKKQRISDWAGRAGRADNTWLKLLPSTVTPNGTKRSLLDICVTQYPMTTIDLLSMKRETGLRELAAERNREQDWFLLKIEIECYFWLLRIVRTGL